MLLETQSRPRAPASCQERRNRRARSATGKLDERWIWTIRQKQARRTDLSFGICRAASAGPATSGNWNNNSELDRLRRVKSTHAQSWCLGRPRVIRVSRRHAILLWFSSCCVRLRPSSSPLWWSMILQCPSPDSMTNWFIVPRPSRDRPSRREAGCVGML